MKINSNTIKLDKGDFKNVESILKKIASDNGIGDINSIEIKLSKDSGLVSFKKAGPDNYVTYRSDEEADSFDDYADEGAYDEEPASNGMSNILNSEKPPIALYAINQAIINQLWEEAKGIANHGLKALQKPVLIVGIDQPLADKLYELIK